MDLLLIKSYKKLYKPFDITRLEIEAWKPQN